MEKQIKLFHVGNSNTFFSPQLPFNNAPCVPYITQNYFFWSAFHNLFYSGQSASRIVICKRKWGDIMVRNRVHFNWKYHCHQESMSFLSLSKLFCIINFFLSLSVRLVQTKREDTYSSPGWKHVPCTSSMMCKKVIGTIHSLQNLLFFF